MERQYRYYAIVDSEFTLANPKAVVREWFTERGTQYEEWFSGNLKWEHSDMLLRISRGDDYEDAVRITEAEAERAVTRKRQEEGE